MQNYKTNTHNESDLDIDQCFSYEDMGTALEDSIPDRLIFGDDLFHELWEEKVRERDLIFEEMPFEGLDYGLSEEELIYIKNNVLSVVSKVLTPMQVVALYFYSNYEAESTNCPLERKRFILKEMSGSSNLSFYGIEDLNEFRISLDKLDPVTILELTNIIYRSQILPQLIIKRSNKLERLYAKINDLNQADSDIANSKVSQTNNNAEQCSNIENIQLGNEYKSIIKEPWIIDPETSKFHDCLSYDLAKQFSDAGYYICWSSLDINEKVIIHFIQPNHLHCLVRFNSETETLSTIVMDLTKEEMISYLKENYQMKNPTILEYEDLDLSYDGDLD